jgi:hypothetical protein
MKFYCLSALYSSYSSTVLVLYINDNWRINYTIFVAESEAFPSRHSKLHI